MSREVSLAGDCTLSVENYVWGLQSICRLHRIPFAPELVVQQFPPPYNLVSLQHAAATLGFRADARSVAAGHLAQIAPPFIAFLRTHARVKSGDSATRSADGHGEGRLVVVLKRGPNEIVYTEQGSAAPLTSSLADFERCYAGFVFMCSPTAPELTGEDAALITKDNFGFRWFMTELLKHRRIWRDVLLASLVIQLMALATPVFTQVVIDKVIVHHTTSTLMVIGLALSIFIVFTSILSWIRQRNRTRDPGAGRGYRASRPGAGAHGHAPVGCGPQRGRQ